MDEKVQKFNKYNERGAYHWREMEPGLRRFNPQLAARYELSLEMVRGHCHKPSAILDVGCGDGVFTALLADRFRDGKVVGYDTDGAAIRFARKMTASRGLTNLSFIEGDPFDGSKEVDLISATDVIEHLYDPDRFLEKAYGALRRGGYLFLSTPIRRPEVIPDPYHVKEFEFDEFATFSSTFGFSVVDHKSSHDLSYLKKFLRVYRMGIGRLRPFKYLYAFLATRFGRNVFKETSCVSPTMQYILLRKPG